MQRVVKVTKTLEDGTKEVTEVTVPAKKAPKKTTRRKSSNANKDNEKQKEE